MNRKTTVNIFWALFMISSFLFLINIIASVTLTAVNLSWLLAWVFCCWLTVVYTALFPHTLKRSRPRHD